MYRPPFSWRDESILGEISNLLSRIALFAAAAVVAVPAVALVIVIIFVISLLLLPVECVPVRVRFANLSF